MAALNECMIVDVHNKLCWYLQNGTAESLEKQFEIVKRETTTSPVQQYGDLVSSHRMSLLADCTLVPHLFFFGPVLGQ